MEKLLVTNKLTKQYGDFKAVEAVDLNVYHGDIYGLIGRNGAGKSTLLKMLSGLASPSSGEFNFFGLKMSNERNSNTKILSGRIGTLIENPGYFPNMSATENLKTKCIALGIKRKNYIADLLELIGLENTGNKKVKNFSLGMKQRLGLGLALIGEPDLVILDEPINGLDPQGIA
ncbi:MAG: ATP-binding cassette domain-containing protein, partial [Clostridiaceae bacterium]|nr:ATP-binding cassette domain-containing protein [Clostridiaceae bacterium]